MINRLTVQTIVRLTADKNSRQLQLLLKHFDIIQSNLEEVNILPVQCRITAEPQEFSTFLDFHSDCRSNFFSLSLFLCYSTSTSPKLQVCLPHIAIKWPLDTSAHWLHKQ